MMSVVAALSVVLVMSCPPFGLRAEPMMVVDDPDTREDDNNKCVDRVILHLYKVSCTRLVVQG